MNKSHIYLDNAATTQPDPVVVEAMQDVLLERWGNPSSIHDIGRSARSRLDEARSQVAQLAGCHDDEVYFTSGGTEADNWAILGTLDHWQGKRNHVVTLNSEHHAVLDTVNWCKKHGYEITVLPVDQEGRITSDAVASAISDNTALVSIMQVNNELGTIQDIHGIGQVCQSRGVAFHADCVQSLGKIPFRFSGLGADMASISSHKIYGPKGVGALMIKRGTRISPRFIGGSQERGLRTGTENVPGIVGFGAAAEICRRELSKEMAKIQTLRDRLEGEILDKIPDVRVNGSREHRSPGILNVSFTGCEGEALLVALDLQGVCVSTGSACSAGAIGASHVLIALGLDPVVAQASIRFSLGRFNSDEEIEKLLQVLPEIVEQQRIMAPAYLRG